MRILGTLPDIGNWVSKNIVLLTLLGLLIVGIYLIIEGLIVGHPNEAVAFPYAIISFFVLVWVAFFR